ncbi:DUF6311 domain-containing protein [Lonsdalea quercina]|uniref:DUF6311 domain-containing protein n=1 Tax=Lonsdalea quercina TaxID=71657 RepID=UPI003974EC8B
MEVSNSIVYTDSNPLLALFFKLFSGSLPKDFQYFGLWLYACCIFNALILYKIITLFVENKIYAMLGVILIMFNPAWINRVGHLNLMGHFLILSAIYLCLKKHDKHEPSLWAALLILSCTIHFYIAMMVYIFWLVNLITRAYLSNKIKKGLSEFIAILACSLLVMYMLGYFSVGNVAVHDGFGQFNNNLLSPLMPSGWSSFLNGFNFNADGFEGFNYWGLGFVFIFSTGVMLARNIHTTSAIRVGLLSIIISMLLFLLISTTNHIEFGSVEAIIPIPDFLLSKLSIFRASSRFFWPITYIVIIASVVVIYKSLNYKYASVVVLIAIVIQISDINPGFSREGFYFFNRNNEATVLEDSFWSNGIKNYKSLRYVPFSNPSEHWKALSNVANKNGMRTDAVYLARVGDREAYRMNIKVEESLFTGRYDDSTVYVLNDYFFDKVKLKVGDFICRLDELKVLAPGFQHCEDVIRGSGDEKHNYMLSGGWSTYDERGTWNDGNFASIVFKNDLSAKSISVDYSPFLTNNIKSQRVIAKINGKVIASYDVDSVGTLQIPYSGNNGEEYGLVEFEMPDATSPSEQGLSIDGRRLTIAIKSFQINH